MSITLDQVSIHAFIEKFQIKNEKGDRIDFTQHRFLRDIYKDLTPILAVMKAAQVGMTTAEVIKTLWGIKNMGMDGIYCLPTDSDVSKMVSSKVNRIIANNPELQNWTQDKDSIEQKQIGNNFIHYKGTWSQKAAIMTSSDWNSYDEIDASKQDVIEQYATRLQHSKYKYEHYFSHPSVPGYGIHKVWEKSDQKHWFVHCSSCSQWDYLHWPDSIDTIKRVFQCKHCRMPLTDSDRRFGKWVKRFPERQISGYWIPLLICPWVSAGEIIDYHNQKSEEYFYNKVLGLPYSGGGSKLTQALFNRNLTTQGVLPEKKDERIVIGVDTGAKIHWVAGGLGGLFAYAEDNDYEGIRGMLDKWSRAIVVIDQGGDLIGSRKLREDYPGRVFLCSYGEDRKTQELVRWGAKDENGTVIADRNRMIQLVVSEFTDKMIPVYGEENDWYDYWLHWNNLSRIKEENDRGMIRRVWVRNGADHWAHSTVYWRVGMARFGGVGFITGASSRVVQGVKGIEIRPDGTADINEADFWPKEEQDWRDIP